MTTPEIIARLLVYPTAWIVVITNFLAHADFEPPISEKAVLSYGLTFIALIATLMDVREIKSRR